MKSLLVFALEQESQNMFEDHPVLYTGVGKVNAAYGLMKAVAENRPDLVINLGTAGSRKHKAGNIINPTRFVQRDMDVTPLGFAAYQTPFSDDPPEIEYGLGIEALTDGVCGTGDHFDVSELSGKFDVVDMEAYALALACQREQIPFLCLKYISDGADGQAASDWGAALRKGAETLYNTLQEINL